MLLIIPSGEKLINFTSPESDLTFLSLFSFINHVWRTIPYWSPQEIPRYSWQRKHVRWSSSTFSSRRSSVKVKGWIQLKTVAINEENIQLIEDKLGNLLAIVSEETSKKEKELKEEEEREWLEKEKVKKEVRKRT